MASAMDRIFSSMANVGNRVLGRETGVTDPSQDNSTVPGPGTNILSDGSVKAIPAVSTGNESPMAEYKDLFVNDPAKPVVGIPSPMPSFALQPDKLSAASSGIDFTASITAAEVAEVFPGVPEAAARTILNKMGAKNFEATFTAGTRTMEEAMSRQSRDLTDKTIPEVIRRQAIASLNGEQPLKINPATAPVFSMLENQFAGKYPNASAAEIAAHTQKYMEGMMGEVATSTGKQVTAIPKQKQEMDWTGFDEDTMGAGAIFN